MTRTPDLRRRPSFQGLISVAAASLLWSLASWAAPPTAHAQVSKGKGANQIRATQTRPAPRNTTTPGRYRGQGRYRGAGVIHGRPKHPVSPYLGSAIGNAIPYRQHDVVPGPIYPYYPSTYRPPAYVFYVDNFYDGEPRVYGEAEAQQHYRDRQVSQQPVVVQPAPVYIVQPVQTLPSAPGAVAGSAAGTAADGAIPAPRADSLEPPRRPRPEVPQAVVFQVVPADATVLLDDEPLGSAAEVMSRSPLILDPGVYVLEVFHPDFPSQRLVFGVDGREGFTVAVDLGADKPHRRTRVK